MHLFLALLGGVGARDVGFAPPRVLPGIDPPAMRAKAERRGGCGEPLAILPRCPGIVGFLDARFA
jgi:hypothetical protein